MEKIDNNPITINDRTSLTGEKAIYRHKNLFIEAGAGAGKTNYITRKIIDEILEGIEVNRFIVITFTNKATEEMLGRIVSYINECIINKDNLYSQDEIKILQKAKEHIFEMNVSTIHSFCNKLLNENSFKSKLSYGAKLLEENDEEKRINKLYASWYRNLTKEDFDIINSVKDERRFKKIKSTYEILCKNFDNAEYEKIYHYDVTHYLELLYQLGDELSSSGIPLGSYAATYVNAYSEFSSKYQSIEKFKILLDKGDDQAIEDYFNFVSAFRKDVNYKGKENASLNEDLVPIKEEISLLKKQLEDYFTNGNLEIVNDYAIKAWEYYKSHRDRENLSNNQLIYEAYKLLQDEEMTDLLANKYDVIFIDEFQDTDKCQIDFIIKLARRIDERKQNDPNAKKTTSLVVVGDPKQSIYRFRGADFTSFSEVRNSFRSFGSNYLPIFFPDNFRSNNYIISYVNDEYAKRNLAEGYIYQPMSVSEKNIVPSNINPDHFLSGVYSYPFNSLENDKFISLARFIKYLVDNKYIIKKEVNKVCDLFPVSYNDFLVLSCSHSEMNDYVKALNEYNIPSQVAGEFDLSSSYLIRIIYRLLKYLLDPNKNNWHVAKNILTSFTSTPVETLKSLYRETRTLSSGGILLYLLNHLSLIVKEFSYNDEKIYNAISKQISENILSLEGQDSISLLNTFEELIKETAKAEIMLSPDINAVRLMNVHQSKGLEGKIVIIVDSGGFAPSTNVELCKSKLYLNNIKLLPEIQEAASKEILEERVRLEYVAVTRSEQVLIFESSFKDHKLFNLDENNHYQLDNEYLEKYHYPGTKLPDFNDVNPSSDDEEKNDVNKSSIELSFIKPTPINESLKIKQYVESSPSLLEDHSDNTQKINEPRRPYDNIFGTVFHRVMELYVNNINGENKNIIKTAVEESINEIDVNILPSYYQALEECLNAVKDLYKEKGYLKNAKLIKPEFKFMDFDDSLYGESRTLMSGSIDLFIVNNDDSVTIIDYKTDIAKYHNKEQFELLLTNSYKNQLQTYKNVINKLLGYTKITTKIIWLEENRDTTIAREIEIK